VSTSGLWTLGGGHGIWGVEEVASWLVGRAFSSAAISWSIAVGSEVSVVIDRESRGARHCYFICYLPEELEPELTLTIKGSEVLSLPNTLARPSKAREGL
jgi:hypothetical protein